MAEVPPAASALRKTAQVSDHEIDGASDAVLTELATEAYPLAKGWTLDLVETLRTNTRPPTGCASRAPRPARTGRRCRPSRHLDI